EEVPSGSGLNVILSISVASGGRDARLGRAVWIAVQLCGFGSPCSQRSSSANETGDSERRVERPVEGFHGTLHGLWAPLDCAGEAASGNAAAGVLWHPLPSAN